MLTTRAVSRWAATAVVTCGVIARADAPPDEAVPPAAATTTVRAQEPPWTAEQVREMAAAAVAVDRTPGKGKRGTRGAGTGRSSVVDEVAASMESPASLQAGSAAQAARGEAVRLSAQDRAGVNLARQWALGSDEPTVGDAGAVVFNFGTNLPTVVCAPLHVCDITLQPGEVAQETFVGDAVRWKVVPMAAGSPARTPHILVKPTQANLESNLIITTDRRTYVVRLVSDRKEWMPRAAFAYPEDAHQILRMVEAAERKREEATILPNSGGLNVEKLDFHYVLVGDASWKPLRVYNDGTKTYVQFPPTMGADDAPALVALGPGNTEELVNYRKKGDRYVVDKVLRRAALLSGVGWLQDRVEIWRDDDPALKGQVVQETGP